MSQFFSTFQLIAQLLCVITLRAQWSHQKCFVPKINERYCYIGLPLHSYQFRQIIDLSCYWWVRKCWEKSVVGHCMCATWERVWGWAISITCNRSTNAPYTQQPRIHVQPSTQFTWKLCRRGSSRLMCRTCVSPLSRAIWEPSHKVSDLWAILCAARS